MVKQADGAREVGVRSSTRGIAGSKCKPRVGSERRGDSSPTESEPTARNGKLQWKNESM